MTQSGVRNWEDYEGPTGPTLLVRRSGPLSQRPVAVMQSAVYHTPMTEVTRILGEIHRGDPHAAERLLPLVYDELRKLATQKIAREKPGQTLQATARRR